MARLEGKVAIVTGGASGIGEATAQLFAESGAAVVVADIDDDRGRKVADGIRGTFHHADMGDPSAVRGLIDATAGAHGRINVLHNNAGIFQEPTPITQIEDDFFERVIDVNLRSIFVAVKHVAPVMARNGGGSIINTASMAGLTGFAGGTAYGTSKAGVVQLTRNAAVDLARDNIRVNAICPGAILTPMAINRRPGKTPEEVAREFAGAQPLPRTGVPRDIAEAALFLASDASAFVTGQALVVDGGFMASGNR